MRVLWSSNAPWAATGYGAQTGAVVGRLVAAETRIVVEEGDDGGV